MCILIFIYTYIQHFFILKWHFKMHNSLFPPTCSPVLVWKETFKRNKNPFYSREKKELFFPRTKKVIKLGLKLYGHLRAFRKTRVMHIVYSNLCIIQQKHMCMRPLMLIYFHCVKKASRWFIWGVIFLHVRIYITIGKHCWCKYRYKFSSK